MRYIKVIAVVYLLGLHAFLLQNIFRKRTVYAQKRRRSVQWRHPYFKPFPCVLLCRAIGSAPGSYAVGFIRMEGQYEQGRSTCQTY